MLVDLVGCYDHDVWAPTLLAIFFNLATEVSFKKRNFGLQIEMAQDHHKILRAITCFLRQKSGL